MSEIARAMMNTSVASIFLRLRKMTTITSDWIKRGESNADTDKMTDFKFYDYAPLVFKYIRKSFGIADNDYLESLGPE